MAANVKDAWQTERLYFRAVCEADYEWLFSEIHGDPINHALSSPFMLAPPRRKKPDEWIKQSDDLLNVVVCVRAHNPTEDETTPDATPDKESRIGILFLRYGGYGPSPHNRSCELGITLGGPHQNQGYGTEAVQWALDWAFRRGNMHSVHLGSIDFNTRAHKCYEKCGFKLEGRARQVFWHDRKWYDCLSFGIIEDEWEALRNLKK